MVATAGVAAAMLVATLSGCTTDQVVDTSLYWGERVVGMTLDNDPGRD